ncbi:MAG: ABC transporter substrate-binding protein [Deltaproteobacteria bacterium]|nr:ABC transporter substrate-binding protein [Deltaproteobacteria bacterium]
MKNFFPLFPLVLSLLLFIPACSKKSKKELWIYTSMYKDMIEMMKEDVQREFPDVTLQWFASGSEKVAAKINAELEAKNLQADILMTSDPFFYIELKNKGLLTPYESPNSKNVPPALKDSEHYFATQRVPVVVMAYNRNDLKPHELPKTFKELTEEKWKGKVVMGSPLESGTTFTAVAALNAKYGWDFFKKLRANHVVAAGGNSTVREKLESKEFSVGIILLENILQAQSQASPLEPIYPEDGVIMVPSPVAIFKRTKDLELAKRMIDFLFSERGQRWMIKANMYSANPMLPPPDNAKPFGFILKHSFPWNSEFTQNTFKEHQTLKDTFSKIMYE